MKKDKKDVLVTLADKILAINNDRSLDRKMLAVVREHLKKADEILEDIINNEDQEKNECRVIDMIGNTKKNGSIKE